MRVLNKEKLKLILKKVRWLFFPINKIYSFLAFLSRKYAYHAHRMLYYTILLSSSSDYYNHNIDLYTWTAGKHPREPHWMERCIYNLLAIKMFDKPVLIELCCGDGYNTRNFYATSCEYIFALDYDKSAIKYAKKNNTASNIEYINNDIRKNLSCLNMHGKTITNVVWDASLIYFEKSEAEQILKQINLILDKSKGILSGMVTSGKVWGETIHSNYKDSKQVYELLCPYFEDITTWEVEYSTRKNIYFYASNGKVPFKKL